jgi:hypothetical protein
MVMAVCFLGADINLLGTEYRIHSGREGGFKSDKEMPPP